MNGDLTPFVGLRHCVGENHGIPKDGLGGVVWLDIEYGYELHLWEITLTFGRDEIGSKCFVMSSI